MWKLCFVALTLCVYASCTPARFEADVIVYAAQSLKCTVEKWANGPVDCGGSEKIILCDIWRAKLKGNALCNSCIFLCVSNGESCKFTDRFFNASQCQRPLETNCEYLQLSREHFDCPESTIRVAVDSKGLIFHEDFGTRFSWYTCVKDACKDIPNICPRKPNAECSIGYKYDCRATFEGMEPGDCNCSSNQVYHDEEIPCQKMCDRPDPVCQFRPMPGCGCRSDQFWNGLECVDQCEECPPGVARTNCDEDPCKKVRCYKYHSHKGLECKAHTCGGCRPKFYFNGKVISVEDCNDGCAKNYWIKVESKETKECPVCNNGCVCYKTKAEDGDLIRTGRAGSWMVYNCFLPNREDLSSNLGIKA